MNEENPFRPPEAALADPLTLADRLASRGQRFRAAMVDAVIGILLAVPGSLAFGTWDFVRHGQRMAPGLLVASTVLGFLLFMAAHGYFLKKNGQTIGKKIIGIRIVDLDGNAAGFGRIVGRRYLPVSLVSVVPVFGPLLAMVDVLFIFRPDRRCLHDLIAGTRVLRADIDDAA